MPEKNQKDLEEIPDHVRETMQFFFVKEMDDVIKLALSRKLKKPAAEKMVEPLPPSQPALA